MAFCRIPPVSGREFVWVGRRYGLWIMGALSQALVILDKLGFISAVNALVGLSVDSLRL